MRAIAPNADLRPFQSSARSCVVGRDAHDSSRRAAARSRAIGVDLLGDAVGQAVDLDEQHGFGVARIARADEVLDGRGDPRVHHLQRGRQHAGGDDPAHGRGRGVDRAERAQHRRDRGRVGREADRDAGRDAHRALGADEAAAQVVAGRVGLEAAEHARSRRPASTTSTARMCADVTPVGQAVRAARVGADVAADRARLLRRRIGRVVQPEVRAPRARGRGSARRARPTRPAGPASTSSTRFIWVVTITTGSSSGVAPPARPVPLPRATNGRPCRARDAHRGRDLLGRPRPAHRASARPRRRPRHGRTARARAARRSHAAARPRRAGRRGA